MTDNLISGTLPAEIGALTNLGWFLIALPCLSYRLAESFSFLDYVETFRFENNTLEGTIPTEIGNLSKLGTYLVGDELPCVSWIG